MNHATETRDENDVAHGRLAVELRNLSKRYGTLRATDDVSLNVRAGEIHVLVGENGAGKSTLMGMLSGTVSPDSGAIVLDGADVTGQRPREAIARGVGMVHQHFRLVGAFTVAENIALGFEPRSRYRTLDRATARRKARDVSQQFGLALDPDALVDDMSVGMQQRVEIVKTLAREAKVMIFDEPTAVLTEREAASLVDILRRLRDAGRAILLITHNLREAIAVGDVISVLRRGKLVATLRPSETDAPSLGALMVGRDLEPARRETSRPSTDGGIAVSVAGAGLASKTLHGITLKDLHLQVRSGEILGVLGVEGNGQQELVSLLTGLVRPDVGTVEVGGRDMTGRDAREFLKRGVGIIPGDRHQEGLVLSMSIARNLVLDRRSDRRFFSVCGAFVREKRLTAYAQTMMTKYDVRAQNPSQLVGSLSGGNQQKVVIARELEREISLLVAANPTRGLDVGSIEFVHKQLLSLADNGVGVVVVTADIDEAMALSDRIAVLFGGSIIGTVRRPFGRHEVGALMGGL